MPLNITGPWNFDKLQHSWKDWAGFLVSHITLSLNATLIHWKYGENYSYIKQDKYGLKSIYVNEGPVETGLPVNSYF